MSRQIFDLLPEVAQKCVTLMQDCTAQGITLVVVQTWRTHEEQALLYAQGRSLPGSIVTYAKPGYSWHEFQRAFDVAFRVGLNGVGWDGPWDTVGAAGKALGLDWGGDFPHKDFPHFEFKGGHTLEELRHAAGLPD